ncbi:TfpX/TfpZ family type IV pilin accessory protein [Acinetobacter indicus]|uniref:TfpX/TfpZ family type IV pilin accessory protein n=1 Tax=Acinetobacter indicus TaxID=756892 RepID=UPI002AF6A3A5|nr:TfpX/TfpZ family type IV pilin accessory protein [Acinetobacter indicus]
MVFWVWYPTPLSSALGVTHILFILLVIDLVLGPILGFMVYKEGKKSLKFDLGVIISLQVIALIYGIYSIERARPVWLVYYANGYEIVQKNAIDNTHIDKALKEYQKPSWLRPQFVAIQTAQNIDQHNDDVFEEVLGGISLAQKPERYLDINQVKLQIRQKVRKLSELKKYNDESKITVTLNKYPQANAWLPLKANAVDMVVLINKEAAEVIKIVDLRPWH